jgi:purine-nucleoside phosphorylase
MTNTLSHKYTKAAGFLTRQFSESGFNPICFVALGSGFIGAAGRWPVVGKINTKEVPFFPVPQVKGHGTDLIMARPVINGKPRDVILATGRTHLYEGFSADDVCFPVKTMAALGIRSAILTNASGGISAKASPGDILIISDHINLTGHNVTSAAIRGLPVSFTDMHNAYDKNWRDTVKSQCGISEGIYAGMAGPTFETPAEARMLGILGADLAGMSTVQEVIAARTSDMRVLGLSFVTNRAGEASDHKDVLALVEKSTSRIISILEVGLGAIP